MEFRCPSCDHQIVIGAILPKFCEQCGSAIKVPSAVAAAVGKKDESEITVAPSLPRVKPDDAPQMVKTIGRYVLTKQLGSGGMGVVYQAVESETGREVALKLLSSGLTADPDNVDRFVREARLAAQISHPRSTFVYEAGHHKGRPYIVMELMPGRTLQDVLETEKSITVSRAVDYVIDVIDGLSAAHKLNVIHRDVKPSNCFVGTDGRIKVGDFGLSKSLVTDVELTRTGTFMGTPSFAAPEQIRGADADLRTDVYAVGATLYCLIANRPPFEGDAMSVTAQIISDAPASLRSIVPSVPRDLDRIIDRTLKKDPDDRYADLAELRDALLPFATRGTSLTQIGRRSAAYMIDYVMVGIVVQFISFAVIMATGNAQQLLSGKPFGLISVSSAIISWTAMFLYFALMEGRFGWSAGKKILGLRVINDDGETPGILRGALRSFVIPSAFAIPVIAALIRWQFSVDTAATPEIDSLMTGFILARAAELLPVMICLLTMRNANGLRGIHGFLSGTRVIRLAQIRRTDLKQLPTLETFENKSKDRKTIGPFVVDGFISGNRRCKVFSGRDTALDRKVLIYQWSQHGLEQPINRHVNRPVRVRFIQGGVNEQGRWEAFEFVDGFPFGLIADNPKLFTWENTRNAIHDIVSELDTSSQEGSLPANLTIDQFFIDRTGHGKLLEISLPTEAQVGEDTQYDETVDDRCEQDESDDLEVVSGNIAACRLINHAFDRVLEKQVVPNSVRRLLESFKMQVKSPDTISRFSDRLEQANQNLARLNWDSRLGVLAVTVGSELVALAGIIVLTAWIWVSILGFLPLWKPLSLVGLISILFFAIGFAMKGSPVFRFMKIDIQHRNGGPASRLQCGTRNLLSWLPFVIFMVGYSFIIFTSFEQTELTSQSTSNLSSQSVFRSISSGQNQQDSTNEASKDTESDPNRSNNPTDDGKDNESQMDQPDLMLSGDVDQERFPLRQLVPEGQRYPFQFLMLLMITGLALIASIVFGFASIIWPDRGIQDRICRTRLVPD